MDRQAWRWAVSVLTGVVLVWCACRVAVLGFHGALCRMPVIADKSAGEAAARSAGACLEYWFNRYQTLLGVLAAIGAAWLTWRAGEKNVARVDAGLELSRRQLAATAVVHLERRKRDLVEARQAIQNSWAVTYTTLDADISPFEHDLAPNIPLDARKNYDEKFIEQLRQNTQKCANYAVNNLRVCDPLAVFLEEKLLQNETRHCICNCIEWQREYSSQWNLISDALRTIEVAKINKSSLENGINLLKESMNYLRDIQKISPFHYSITIIEKELRNIDGLIAESLAMVENIR